MAKVIFHSRDFVAGIKNGVFRYIFYIIVHTNYHIKWSQALKRPGMGKACNDQRL
jgi:hypothetical protein